MLTMTCASHVQHVGQGFAGQLRLLRRQTSSRAHPFGYRPALPRHDRNSATASRRPSLPCRLGGASTRVPVRRHSHRRPSIEHRRGRGTSRVVHSRSSPLRAGRVRRRRTTRRARLRDLPIPLARNQPTHRSVRWVARKPQPAAVRNHRWNSAALSAQLQSICALITREIRVGDVGDRRCLCATRRHWGHRLHRHVVVGCFQNRHRPRLSRQPTGRCFRCARPGVHPPRRCRKAVHSPGMSQCS